LLSFSSVQTRLAKFVTDGINSKYDTEILIEKVDLSSLRNIELKNLLIKDHHQDSLIYVNRLSASILNLRNIIESDLILGDVEIEKGKLLIRTYKGEKINNLTLFTRKFKNDKKKSEKPFQLKSSSVTLKNIYFSFFNENTKKEPIVYYTDISAYLGNFEISEDIVITAAIRGLKTKENHKINITSLNTNFLYSFTKMEFLDTELRTEKSTILADIVFDYEDGDLSNFNEKVMINAEFKNADIALTDLKKLYSEFGENDRINFRTKFEGTINDFVLRDIDLKSNRNFRLKGTVHLKDVVERENLVVDATLENISSHYEQLKILLPHLVEEKIPKSFEKIGKFESSGSLVVTKSSVYSKLSTKSDLGAFKTDIEIKNINNIENATYVGKIEFEEFNLGEFVNDSLVGYLSMVGEINGKGFTMDKINTKVVGFVSKHQYKGYTYSNININGVLKDLHFNGELIIDDPNIQLEFKGLADLSNEDYIFDFKADIVHADFDKLNLYTRDEMSILKGKIDINLTGRNLDNIVGDINFKETSYSDGNNDYYFKDFDVSSSFKDSIREVKINSTEIINGSVKGNFKLEELKKLTLNSLGSLIINYQKEDVSKGQFLDFNFNIYSKIVDVFFPEVDIGANTTIKGSMDSDKDKFKLSIKSPRIDAFENIIENINLQIDNTNPLFHTILSVDHVDTKYYNVADVNLVNVSLKDTIFVRTDFIGGKEMEEKYNLSFYYTVNENNQNVFGIKKSEITFKNNTWALNPDNNDQNKFVFNDSYKSFVIDNVNMVSGNQSIDLAGLFYDEDNRNIDLKFNNVNLIDITPSIDSVVVDGKINGTISLKKLEGKTLPFADLIVNYFSINDDYYGDLTIYANGDETIKNYNFVATLLNSGLQSFYVMGQVDFNGTDPIVSAEVNFDKFRLNSFTPLGKNVLTNIRGFVTGSAIITGPLSNPSIDGELFLKEAGLRLPYLGINYNFLGDAKVSLYEQIFDFQLIDLEDDVMKTVGTVNGTISHKGFRDWSLDLEILTDRLLILNTQKSEDALYYGTGLISGTTTLKGPTDDLVIDMQGTTEPGTEFIIPLNYISTTRNTKLIHFEGSTTEDEDEDKKKEIIFEELKGLSLNFNLHVTKDAVAQVVIDKVSGSLLKGSCDGDLSFQIDTKGKFEMYGAVVVDNGEYQFKNIINKDFKLTRGGTIVWDGNPFDAELNIEAVNRTKANPSVLLDEINSSRKIDVELITRINGSLSDAQFTFDINIPNASSMVSSELDFILKNDDDKLAQFFSLLATGSFMRIDRGNTEFNSSAAITGTIAQNASKILTEVLKSSNEDIEIGVTYDIGDTNNVQDVTTDNQLGILVSGRIADRVIVSGKVGVPVGSRTNSNVIGEVEVEIPLNESETLRAKVYNRQNEIQFDVIDGEGYTQGVGISYQFDFDNGKEFLNKIGWKTPKELKAAKKTKDSLKLAESNSALETK